MSRISIPWGLTSVVLVGVGLSSFFEIENHREICVLSEAGAGLLQSKTNSYQVEAEIIVALKSGFGLRLEQL